MHSLIKSLLVVSLFASTIALAQPEGEVVITTRDGKTRQGRVLSETAKGYLFATSKGTSVIAFDKIVGIKNVDAVESETAPVPPASASAPVKVAQNTPPPAPVAAPIIDTDFTSPPPPPSRPVEAPRSEVSIAAEPLQPSERTGVHFGVGAFGGLNPGGLSLRAQGNFEFNFGVPEYRASLNISYLNVWGMSALNVSADNLLQLNFGDVYALAFGVQVGVVTGVGTYFYGAPVLEPVIIKLGERGQHRLSLSGSIPVLSSFAYTGSGYASWAGMLQVTAGYSFYF